MRHLIINSILFCGIGGFMSYIGYYFDTWQYWIIMIAMLLVATNNRIEN